MDPLGAQPFTSKDWDTPRIFWVTGRDDELTDGDAPLTISMAAAKGSAKSYESLPASTLETRVLDDDPIWTFDTNYYPCEGPAAPQPMIPEVMSVPSLI